MQKQITVYDEDDLLIGKVPNFENIYKYKKNRIPEKIVRQLQVDAWCVAGTDGFLAFFYYDKYFCIASGDDGFWQLLFICDKSWAKDIKEAMSYVTIR